MEIKLLCREISLTKVDKNSEHLKTALTGSSYACTGEIYFDGDDPFPVLMHEIAHIWLYRCGYVVNSYSEEQMCSITGKMTDQLMLENGDDIIVKLKEFANG